VFIGLYLYHYSTPSIHSSPLNSIRHPLLVLQYVAGYLGVIFPPWIHIRELLAVSSGFLGLLIGLVVTTWVFRRRPREPLHVALLAVMYFSVATALITALGRVDFGLAQAFSSRYQTFNLLFWFSAVILLLFLADETNPSARTLVLGIISATMVLAFAVFPLGFRASRTRTKQAEAAATSLLADVPDKQALGVFFEDLPLVWRDANYFRQQHLFMFSDVKNEQMGQLLASIYQVDSPRQCQGRAIIAERIPTDELLADKDAAVLRLTGWAFNGPSDTPSQTLIITANDKIIGFGASIAGPFTAKHSELIRKSPPGEWLGFARPPRAAAVIDVFAIDRNAGAVCRLATVEVPQP
jgi:hypothetical protein